MLPNELLAQLEAHRAGRLSETEHKELLAALAALPDGPAEAAAYTRLWEGLDALRHTVQTARFVAWDGDWKDSDDTELIEWYLAGKLSAENAERVVEREKNDPAFAAVLAEQARLQQGFAAARDEKFRQRLNRWEEGMSSEETPANVRTLKPSWVRRLAVAAGVFMLVVAGVLLYNGPAAIDAPALAESYYKPPPTGNTLGGDAGEENTYLADFTAAHQAMQDGDYTAAYEQLSALATQLPPADFSDDDLKYYQDNLDWNIILALLGKNADPGMINRRLDTVLADPEHTYYGEAVKLREELE